MVAIEGNLLGRGACNSSMSVSPLGIEHVLLELGHATDSLMTCVHHVLKVRKLCTREGVSWIKLTQLRDQSVEGIRSLDTLVVEGGRAEQQTS